MNYRYLKEGEVIQQGDDVEFNGSFIPALGGYIGKGVSKDAARMELFRRPIPEPTKSETPRNDGFTLQLVRTGDKISIKETTSNRWIFRKVVSQMSMEAYDILLADLTRIVDGFNENARLKEQKAELLKALKQAVKWCPSCAGEGEFPSLDESDHKPVSCIECEPVRAAIADAERQE